MSWWGNLFKRRKKQVVKAPEPVKVEPKPAPLPQLPVGTDFWQDWCRKALEISQKFEGSDPWANITGNFDGAGLTCGALGWTFKWNNQQPKVQEFVSRHGIHALNFLMPRTGKEYWQLCQLKTSEGIRLVSRWSRGYNVNEPYKSELRTFWKSPEMIAIQVEVAWREMGAFAKEKTIEFQKYLGHEKPLFQVFAFYFDQAVQNGTGKTIPLQVADRFNIDESMNWIRTAKGAGDDDLRENYFLWKRFIPSSPRHELLLLKLAHLRARISNDKWDTDVMNRRGTLAIGQGRVHGRLYTFDWL